MLGNLSRAVAYEQQVLQFRCILLHEKIYTQHEDIETENAYQQSYRHHYRYKQSQERCRLLGVEVAFLKFITMTFKI